MKQRISQLHRVSKHRVLKKFMRFSLRYPELCAAWMLQQPTVQLVTIAGINFVQLSEQLTGTAAWAPYYDPHGLRALLSTHP